MKTFEELLNENGVKAPRFFGKKSFQRTLREVKSSYEDYCKDWMTRNSDWEVLRQDLKKHWGEYIPSLQEIEPLPEFRFSKLRELNSQIKNLDKSSICALYEKLDKELRAKWIQEIISAAPVGKSFIVIKGSHYTHNKSNQKKFAHAVRTRNSATINLMGISPLWVAFNIHEEYDPEYWLMYKSDSDVFYFS